MSKAFKPITKEELEKRAEIPKVHREAIEHALWEMVLPEPEDEIWPDYFRAEEVAVLSACVLSEEDFVDKGEYNSDCGWFQAGWKAALNALKSLKADRHRLSI